MVLTWVGLVTARIARMYSFCLVCVCVFVRVPKTDNFITTSHFAFTWGLYPFRHVRLFICPSRLGCLSRAFCPFNGLRSTPNQVQTLPGHADKKAYPYLLHPPTHTSPLRRQLAVQSSLELIIVLFLVFLVVMKVMM